jgi:hypothetical protein
MKTDMLDPSEFNKRIAEISLSMDTVIPKLGGRPKRKTVISREEILDVAIDANVTKSSQSFLRKIK